MLCHSSHFEKLWGDCRKNLKKRHLGYAIAYLNYTPCFVNNFRSFRAMTILNTNSETRILGYFDDITHIKIGRQLVEVFELKKTSSILTWGLCEWAFSDQFYDFGRPYLPKY